AASAVAAVPGSARWAGMGGAGAAVVGDAGVIFTNPAGLATVHRLAVEGSYEAYPSGSTLSTGAMALRAGRFTWGAGAAALGQTYTSADLLGVSSLVFRSGLAAIGTSVKYARETVAGARVDAWAGDVGIAIAVFDIMAPAAQLGPRGAAPVGVGGNRGSHRAGARVRDQRRCALPRAGRRRGGAHPAEAPLDREAGRGCAHGPGAAPAAGARARGPRLCRRFARVAGGGDLHDLRGRGPGYPAAGALGRAPRPVARVHVAIPHRGHGAVQGVLRLRAGARGRGRAGAGGIRHLPPHGRRVL